MALPLPTFWLYKKGVQILNVYLLEDVFYRTSMLGCKMGFAPVFICHRPCYVRLQASLHHNFPVTVTSAHLLIRGLFLRVCMRTLAWEAV